MALPDDPDTRLIDRLVARDERAFNELVRSYEGRIVRLLTRMVGNEEEAKDLAQDVFVQVFKAVGTFRGDSKFSTWLYRIAVNLCKNRVKYLRVRHANEREELDSVTEKSLGDARPAGGQGLGRPDEQMAGKQVERIVQVAIQELEPSFRECLVLRDVEELSYEEIEQITGLPAGTVKSRIHRARAMLREKVERELGEKLMTDPQQPKDAEVEDAESADESGPPSSRDPMAALLKRSFEAPAAKKATPSILQGVQRRIRKRSRGKFFADGWSTSDARVSHALIAGAMLLILVLSYFALGPVGVQ